MCVMCLWHSLSRKCDIDDSKISCFGKMCIKSTYNVDGYMCTGNTSRRLNVLPAHQKTHRVSDAKFIKCT